MRERRIGGWTCLLAALALLAGACSSDTTDEATDDASSADTAASVDSGSDDDGSGGGGDSTDSDDDASLPASDQQPTGAGDDFPVAIPDGWIEDLLDFEGSDLIGGVNLLYPNDDFDRLVSFYEEWTAEQTEEYAQTASGDVVIFTRLGGEGLVNITITRNEQQSADGAPAANLLISAT